MKHRTNIICLIVVAALAAYIATNHEYIRPNLIEGIALVLAPVIVLIGCAILRRRNSPAHWDAPAHQREMKARQQKERESLPPGQL